MNQTIEGLRSSTVDRRVWQRALRCAHGDYGRINIESDTSVTVWNSREEARRARQRALGDEPALLERTPQRPARTRDTRRAQDACAEAQRSKRKKSKEQEQRTCVQCDTVFTVARSSPRIVCSFCFDANVAKFPLPNRNRMKRRKVMNVWRPGMEVREERTSTSVRTVSGGLPTLGKRRR